MKILDHGHLKKIEHWGSDERIIEAARQSTGKGFLGWGPTRTCSRCDLGTIPDPDDVQPFLPHPYRTLAQMECQHDFVQKPGDEKLLRYLWENKHSTPFEVAGMTVEVQAPIFVFREWHRHRVPFGYSEMSSRYVPLPDFNYVPTVERLMMNSKTNKQAGTIKGAEELTEENAEVFREGLNRIYRLDEEVYQAALKMGVPKELARVHLPVGRYSRMYATANLRGWLAFLTLRLAPNAQFEIRVYAEAVGNIIAETFPRTWELFVGSRSTG